MIALCAHDYLHRENVLWMETKLMSEQQSNSCFVCGPSNPIWLGCTFQLEGDLCVSEYRSRPEHCGYDGVTHGGIVYSLLDDVMANWVLLNGEQAFTARCDIRYRKPMPIGTHVRMEGWQKRRKGRLAQLSGRVFDVAEGTVFAEADASFMIEGPA